MFFVLLSCFLSTSQHASVNITNWLSQQRIICYVLGFYSDPHDKTATYESVSPENMFKDRLIDDFSSLPDPTELVSKSNK